MKCRSHLAVGITVIGTLIGSSLAQNLPTRNWDAANLQHRVYAVLPFDVPGTPRQLLLIATAPPNETCHACAPVTGVVMFELKDGTWRVGSAQPDIGNLGTFGRR